jgi:hypothetical protein
MARHYATFCNAASATAGEAYRTLVTGPSPRLIFWLKDDSLEHVDSLPEPDV